MSQNDSKNISQLYGANYKNEAKKILKKDYLPTEISKFLEKLSEVATPTLKKKIEINFDKHIHAQGKSVFTREELFPYANYSKVYVYLLEILSIDFDKELQKSEFISTLQEIRKNIENNKKYSHELLEAFIKEDETFYQAQAEISSTYSFLCYFIANIAFLPFFIYTREQAETKAEIKYDEIIWQHGHCPYCGSAPLLSYLKEKEGKRVHACSTCLGMYRVPRIQCPYCLEQKQEKLTYFTADNEKDCQVSLCKNCKNYIKIFDLRENISFNPNPLLDDYKTLTLDLIAENQNYTKAVLSLWIY